MSGVRVVRAPDWDWGDQDGGEGFVGTVVWQEEGSGKATVQWDTANRHSYCCGYGGKYDLRVLDTAPAGSRSVQSVELRIFSVVLASRVYDTILYNFGFHDMAL